MDDPRAWIDWTKQISRDYDAEREEAEMAKKTDIEKRTGSVLGPFETEKSPSLVKYQVPHEPIPGYEDWTEPEDDLPPVLEFSQPGQRVDCTYMGYKIISKFNTRMYALIHESYDKPFGMWGCTILDKKIDSLGLNNGERILIVYEGEVPTARGQSPAKDFRVMVKR
jgi:hypothetical protein